MKLIRTITEEDFGRQSTPEKWASYPIRPSARAILINDSNEIALMHVTNRNYYKLPGGGIDGGEKVFVALARELKEEAGASNIEIIKEVGQIDEYRDLWERKSEHYAFITKLIGPLGESERTDKEIEHGYEITWAKNLEEAIRLVESGKPSDYGQDFERLRELIYLKYIKAQNLL